MKIVSTLFSILVFMLGISCSRDVSNKGTNNQQTVTTKSIKSLSMNCQGSMLSCSGSVGALLIFNNNQLETFCTAFVIAESLEHSILATSSHCLKQEHRNIQSPTVTNKDYVYTKYDVSTPNRVSFFDVNEIIYSNHNHSKNLGLDYAYMSTFKRVNVPDFKIHHNSIDRSELLLKVTTANFDKDNLLISIQDHNNCTSVADRSQMFKSMFYNPENFGIQNCSFHPGNSGAPVFFNNTIAGILNSGLVEENSSNSFYNKEIFEAYANNILCTESLRIKKASRNKERPMFSQKWFCTSTFKRTQQFSFLIDKTHHEDSVHELHAHTHE